MREPLSIEELRLALTYIPADDRETWVNIANAVKTEYGDEGFPAWDEWSQGGQSYNAADAKSVWKSLSPGHVSMGTVIKLARDHGWQRQRREMSAADRKRLKAEAEERRRLATERVEADQAKLARMQEAVADACEKVLALHLSETGQAGYLAHKGVGAYGVLFPKRSVLISIDSQRERADVWAGPEVRDWFAQLPKPRPDHLHMFHIKGGSMVLPMHDAQGKLWAFQTILPNGTKLFPKFGRKAGNWHMISPRPEPSIMAVAEGYATSASIYEAMGWPVAVALDAGNLGKVASMLRLLYPDSRLVICGDDDPGEANNPGRAKAEQAAASLGCLVAFPRMEVA